MRQSPTLLALLTLSATLGLASQARGEEIQPIAQVRVADLERVEPTPAPQPPNGSEASAAPSLSSQLPQVAAAPAVDDLVREISFPETLAGTPPATAAAAAPAASPEGLAPQGTRALILSTAPRATPSRATLPRPLWDEAEFALDVPGDVVSIGASVTAAPGAIPEDRLAQAETPVPETEAPQSPEAPPRPAPGTQSPQGDQEPLVLVAEVDVTGVDGAPLPSDLKDRVYGAVTTQPGQTTTRSRLQQDINNIFATGFFANVRAVPEDTPLGVRVTFIVQPNPVLTRVEVSGNDVLPQSVADDIFSPQYGQVINLLEFQDGILELNQWYQENGYVLAQVIAAPQVGADGVVTLVVAEGVIEAIQVRFLTEEGQAENEAGEPIRGKTRDFIITRELQTQPGDIFQQSQIQSDLQRVFALGLFDDVNLTLNPGEKDPRQVTMVINVVERSTGSVAAGVGFNFTGDIFGTLSYRQENFGGNNQKFSAETQLSTRDLLFDISFTDPWIAGDPNRTSYTLNGFARRAISLVFDGGPNEINLANGDRVRTLRFGSGISFRRPLGNGWEASVGTLYQRIRTTDSDGATVITDAANNPLTVSGTGADDLWTVQLGVVRDLRNDPFNPTQGSVLRLGTEQSIPLGSGSIFLNRIRASYSYYVPVSFLGFSEGAQALAFNIQGGTILGDLPPYEAFTIGGTNSVRGYDEGEVGAGRSFLQATAEYRFPLFSFLGGALFVDVGTDLGTGSAIPGSPSIDRGKPGSGFGYGAGLRIQTPLGPIRIDYGFNDQGNGRLHFGIGERF